MIEIRAGILYNLAVDSIEKIRDDILRDVFYQNKSLAICMQYSYYFYLIEEYSPDTCNEYSELDDIDALFEYETLKFVDMLIDAGFNLHQIAFMCSVLYEAKSLLSELKYKIVVNDWKRRENTEGMRYENIAKQVLSTLGFELGESPKGNIVMEDFIMLHGRADAVILSSPGNIYAPGTLVEIKYKCDNLYSNNKYLKQDIIQMAAYSMIFDCDVLYVCISRDEHIECELFTKADLKNSFNLRFKYVVDNCRELMRLSSSDDIKDKLKMTQICRHRQSRRQLFAENID